MSTTRRHFLKQAAAGGVAVPALAAADATGSAVPTAEQDPSAQACDAGKMTHSILEEDHPWIYIDSCMQMWPDGDFDVAHRHGVTAYGVTAWSPPADPATALNGLMYWHGLAREHEGLEVVRTAQDIRRMKREGKAGLLLAAQDGAWIGHDLSRVQAFQEAGLRMMLLVYSADNQLGGGCLDRTDAGLSLLGQRVVEECNRVGVVLDLSHTGRRTTLDIIEHSAHPCVWSHSNCAALVPNPRNVDDEQIRACIAGNGVVGLVSWGPLCLRPDATTRPTVDDYIDHMDHVAQIAGNADHIGMGTDISIGTYPLHEHDPYGAPAYPVFTQRYNELVTSDIRARERNIEGFDDYALIVHLAERLSARGYSDEDVAKILGGNFLRVFEEVWGA
ncbi:MAG: twin-arginine translocation signal domain-containing protein [Gemmatimonadetes bacterium]|nr:twin-arginine translocation signal domain-containing protein [Gemmatimonadota bacterium]